MVYLIAADLVEHRGLLRLKGWEMGIWHGHQLPGTDTRKGRITTVGAIGSGCVHTDCIRAEVAHLAFFRRFAGVEFVAQVEEGRDAGDVAELLRDCAQDPRCA
jgi:hypothetical protein